MTDNSGDDAKVSAHIYVMRVMNAVVQQRVLVIFLRLFGAVTVIAFLPMLMPTDLMAATHRWLGLGEFPRTPIVDYLTRSIAALYGFHGVLLFLLARQPAHYKGIIQYVGVMFVLFGIVLVFIDLHAGMPAYWTMSEGPPLAACGIGVLYLSRSL